MVISPHRRYRLTLPHPYMLLMSPSQPSTAISYARDKPAAIVAYERRLAKTKQPMPPRMKRGLRIFMRGVLATRPCNHCKHLQNPSEKASSNSVRKAYFGGMCVMPGKQPKEYGGCCACIAAGVPGCSAECECSAMWHYPYSFSSLVLKIGLDDASLTPPPSSSSSPVLFTASNHNSALPMTALGKRRRDSAVSPGTAVPSTERDPKRLMAVSAT
jgi:hypothetical protein